ncbi:hypothetical protein EBX31_10610, partial [bacterium]|nr:hypothetical protein [bacterium]
LGSAKISAELGRKVTKDDLYGRLKKITTRGDEVLSRGFTPLGPQKLMRCINFSAIALARPPSLTASWNTHREATFNQVSTTGLRL